MIFEQNYKPTLEDINKNTYITNKAILRYFENTATYHSDAVGGGIKAVETTGQTWIVLDWSVKVLKRPKYGENLKVRTWSRGIQKFFAFRDYELINENNEICVIGTSRWILTDINKNRMVLLNEDIMKMYDSETKMVLPEEEFSKIAVSEDILSEITYTAIRKDIDFNKHMHNLYHLDLAYETLPEDIYENSTFDNFKITYKKEIKLGDTVKCKYSFVDDKHSIQITDADGNIHSIILMW